MTESRRATNDILNRAETEFVPPKYSTHQKIDPAESVIQTGSSRRLNPEFAHEGSSERKYKTTYEKNTVEDSAMRDPNRNTARSS